MKKIFKTRQKGQVMTETVISIAIFTGVILGVVALLISLFVISRTSVNETRAAFLLQEGFEAMRKIRDIDWNNISTLDENLDYYLAYDAETKSWSLSNTVDNIDGFSRKIKIYTALREDTNNNGIIDSIEPISPDGTLVDEDVKRIEITISWKDKSNIMRDYSATSFLTNWH